MITFEEFIQDIEQQLENKPKEWRVGQFVFNYIEEKYGSVAREVQFQDRIDCFYDNDKIKEFVEVVYKRLSNTNTKTTKKYYALMLFETEKTLGISQNPNKWINIKTIDFKDDGEKALFMFCNIPNPASQLLDAESEEELEQQKIQMLQNFNDQNWLNENLYPYI